MQIRLSHLRQSLQPDQQYITEKHSETALHAKIVLQGLQKNYKEKFSHRTKNMKTQQACNEDLQKQKQKMKQVQQGKSCSKHYATTYRPGHMKSIHQSNELILVYLMYKQQKLSLFMNKGVPFEFLLKKMYKQVYIYQKQTYSISNVILKNILHKITGFQSIDNDILYDYELKYKRGALTKQKFFVPFKQEDLKMPFKIYTKISSNSYGGNQFLVRNFSDGEWAMLTTIKKGSLDEQKNNLIKKTLKNNFTQCSVLMKSSPLTFSQINWLETKNYLMVLSQFFPETLQQHLTAKNMSYNQQQKQQIFIYYAKWLVYVFKQFITCNIQNFKKISLKSICLNPIDGLPKISIFDNFINCLDFSEKRRSVAQNGKRLSQKIQDPFYFETYLHLITTLKNLLLLQDKINPMIQQFVQFVEQKMTESKFTFELVLQHLSFSDANMTLGTSQRLKEKHPLEVDFASKIKKIVQNTHITKNNTTLSNQQSLLISQTKQQVQRAFSMENMRLNQHRNQHKSILQMLSTTSGFADLKKENIGNISEFKKQEQRKSHIKTNQKLYVHEIINELNQNQNFIKITKENNLASIGFYLKKSDEKIKKKIIGKIQNKYKKFFEKRQSGFEQDLFVDVSKMVSGNESLVAIPNIVQKQNIEGKVFFDQLSRNSISKVVRNSIKNKSIGSLSPSLNTKRSRLQELFVNRKDYLKEQKLVLKKKKFGIYLQQAEKQYNKIKVYKKNINESSVK